MVLTLIREIQERSLNRTPVHYLPDVHELVVYCPACKTLETLWFNNGGLMPTRKFSQQDKQVFHDCGTLKPCRVYRPL